MGACPKCDGLGVIQFFDPKRVVTNPVLSLAGGAVSSGTWDVSQAACSDKALRNDHSRQAMKPTNTTIKVPNT